MNETTKKRVVTKQEAQTMSYLSKRKYSNRKIAALVGFNESTVRRTLAKTVTDKTQTV